MLSLSRASSKKALLVGAMLALVLAVCLLSDRAEACSDPTQMEQVGRIQMQRLLNMFPRLYNDIRNGNLRPSNQYGNNQNQNYNQNQNQNQNPNYNQNQNQNYN